MRGIVLENFPTALAWLKKTNDSYKFTGSFSRNKMFTDVALCYRVWSSKNPETEEKELKACAWIKPAGLDKQDPVDYTENTFPLSDEGLLQAKQFIIDRITINKHYFE